MMKFKGLGTAVITPFTESLEIDFDALKRILSYLIDRNVNYLVMLGTTGESVTLSTDEKYEILKFTKDIAKGKTQIIAGFGGNNTREVMDEIEGADFRGIDAILSVSPYYNKPSQEGIIRHFKMISDACPVPVIMYNIPGRTGSNMSSDTILKLADYSEKIIAVKEASGNFDQIAKIIKDKPEHFSVISGDDALTLPMLAIGADGVISVIANAYPDEFADMVNSALSGDYHLARQIHYKLYKMMGLLFEECSPAGIKALMHFKGFCGNYMRPPLMEVSQSLAEKIRQAMI